MGRAVLLFVSLLGRAWAVEPCQPDPPAAGVASPAVLRLLEVAGKVTHYHQPAGRALTACVGRLGVFYTDALLPPAEVEGPPVRARGFAVLAWLLGVHQHTFSGQSGEASADLAGARFAGCALARIKARGSDLTRQLQYLEQATAPHADSTAWRIAFTEGVSSCAP